MRMRMREARDYRFGAFFLLEDFEDLLLYHCTPFAIVQDIGSA